MGLKMPELLIILLVLLLIFGASRLPQLGSSLGQSIKNFKKSFSSDAEEPPATGGEKKTPMVSSGAPSGDPQKKAGSREA